jgi:diguanylate cyclase (GGDEF)-like protein
MFKLKKYFVLVGGLTFMLFSVAFTSFYSWHNRNQFTEYGEHLNISQARSLGNSIRENIYRSLVLPEEVNADSLTNRAVTEEINSTIRTAFDGQPFIKAKIFNLDGITIYSSDKREIGKIKKPNPGFISASTYGLPASEMVRKQEISRFSEIFFNRDIVETYIPIRNSDDSIVAVLELYSDITGLVKESTHNTRVLILFFIFGFGLMFGALLIIISRADKILKKQYVDLDESRSALEKSKEVLEATVASRTFELTQTVDKLKGEVDQRKQVEQQLSYQAGHDSLTGLPNRKSLHDAFLNHKAIADESQGHAAMLLVDLDRFKEVNDTLGHHFGDQVLSQVGSRMQQVCSDCSTTIARLGGDEFAIIVNTDKTMEAISTLAASFVDVLREPFMVNGLMVKIGASVGVANYPQHGDDSHELLRAADVAMYEAKKLSIGVKHYERNIDDYSKQRLSFANDLAQAVSENQLVLHYQPKIDVTSGQFSGIEALVRWQHPAQGLLFPDSFIDLVEMSEVIHPFTQAVIELAVRDKKQLQSLGYVQPVAINLSARNLLDDSCFNALDAALEKYNLPSNQVELELTESAIMHSPENAITQLNKFKERGVTISIDDFGTGYSSLAYLRQLPVSALKIDRTFVMDMVESSQDNAIVRSTIALAHSLDLNVIAEGVENNQILMELQKMNCDTAQGFGICRPQPLESLIEVLSTNKSFMKEVVNIS